MTLAFCATPVLSLPATCARDVLNAVVGSWQAGVGEAVAPKVRANVAPPSSIGPRCLRAPPSRTHPVVDVLREHAGLIKLAEVLHREAAHVGVLRERLHRGGRHPAVAVCRANPGRLERPVPDGLENVGLGRAEAALVEDDNERAPVQRLEYLRAQA